MSYTPNYGDSFRIRYLGSVTFSHAKRQVEIGTLQRPLLQLYTTARRRGETHRSAHPLTLSQQLAISDYGLVVAENENRGNGDTVAVVTKVITPISNITLWAAVRFHTRIIKRRVFGAAFVPIACSEAAIDQKSYVQLGSKQKFLVSLTHPSLFACILRKVSAPKFYECHAFVCATGEEALSIASLLGDAKDSNDKPMPFERFSKHGLVFRPSSQSLISDRADSSLYAEETPSDITPPGRPGSYVQSYLNRQENCFQERIGKLNHSPRGHIRRYKTKMDSEEDTPSDITPSKIQSNIKSSKYNYMSKRERMGTPPPTKLSNQPHLRIPYKPEKKKSLRHKTKYFNHAPAAAIISHEMQKRSSRNPFCNNMISVKADFPSGSEAWSEKTETRWEPMTSWHNYKSNKNYRSKSSSSKNHRGSSVTSGESYTSREIFKPFTPTKEMSTMTEMWELENSTSLSDETEPRKNCSTSHISERSKDDRRLRQRPQEHMEMSQTIELSSESELSYKCAQRQQPEKWKAAKQDDSPKIKYTYFGFETFTPPNSTDPVTPSSISVLNKAPEIKRRFEKQNNIVYSTDIDKIYKNAETQVDEDEIVSSEDSGKITISVPYSMRPESSSVLSSNYRTNHIPHGVRSFQRSGNVKNWSTLSQTSDLSYQGSATLPTQRTTKQNKVIRWSSEDRLPRRNNFLSNLKKISLKSLTKAKTKTGNFIVSMRAKFREHMMGKRSPECSEDSAYDASEVCLSPNGNHSSSANTKVRRRLSWSFHDLRSAIEPNQRSHVDSPAGSALGANSARQLVHKRKHRRKRHRRPNESSSSDSGVEEYHSDYSDTVNSFQKSESELEHFATEVTRVRVKHGMSKESFRRWSQTNLQDELGYIP